MNFKIKSMVFPRLFHFLVSCNVAGVCYVARSSPWTAFLPVTVNITTVLYQHKLARYFPLNAAYATTSTVNW